MNLLRLILHEMVWYGFWWLPLIGLAGCFARYLGWPGFFIGALLISVLIVFLDARWIFQEMREHPENGRDADFVFWFGVLCRMLLFNIVLLPATFAGLRYRARARRIFRETKIAS